VRRVGLTGALVLAAAVTACERPSAGVVQSAATAGASPAARAETPTAGTGGDQGVGGSLDAALRAWSDFPEHGDPRPVVALEEVFGTSGFRSGDGKEAFGSGNWNPPATLPRTPATYGGYPVISGSAALDRLRTESAGADPVGRRLTVSDLRLAMTDVLTDRGTMRLPAWRVLFAASTGPNWVLAVAPSRRWERGIPRYFGSQWDARTAAGARALRVTAPSVYDSGFGGGPCVADYTLAVAESDHAVAVRAIAKPGVQPRASVDCHDPLVFSVNLAAPLGARVLVGVTGQEAENRGPIPVAVSTP
jgi:hypothetical protein